MNPKSNVKPTDLRKQSSNSTELWAQEYTGRGIPSSRRRKPSGSVLRFLDFLNSRSFVPRRAVDIGAGTGRNSIFMARKGVDTVALEQVPQLIGDLEREVERLQLRPQIRAVCHDVTKPWPLETSSVDIAIDTFCYKHLATPRHQQSHRLQLQRVLQPGGMFLLTLADRHDGFYAPASFENDFGQTVAIDPTAQILSILYTKNEIEEAFREHFTLASHSLREPRNTMHGRRYSRRTHEFIFTRKDA